MQSALTTQIDEKSDFRDALVEHKIHSVLIIGDSIGDGNCASGHISNMESRKNAGCKVIYSDAEEVYYETLPNVRGWTWYLKRYLEDEMSLNIEVTNASIGSKSARWGNEHKENWITGKYDVIILALGTNDRWDCDTVEEFKENYEELCKYARKRCNYLIVMTPPPSIIPIDNEIDYRVGLREIVEIEKTISNKNGYICADIYQEFMKLIINSDKKLEDFFYGATHPNDYGYLSMWRMLAMELDMTLPVTQFCEEKREILNICERNSKVVKMNTGIDDKDDQGNDIFIAGVTIVLVQDENYCEELTPPGNLMTYKTTSGDGMQVFTPFLGETKLIRVWDSAVKEWTEWSEY